MIKNSVQQLRILEGLTQEELAGMLDVTRQTIISLEKNRYTPSLEMAFKVATLFGMSIDEVFVYVANDGRNNLSG